MITIINYGMGNLGSLQNMFKRIGYKSRIETSPENIKKATKLVLPGVGSFDAAMKCINSVNNLREILNYKALEERVPILGICLGMQLLTSSSEEGNLDGLNWIEGKTVRFPRIKNLKVPHMGWNVAKPITNDKLTANLGEDPRYYFVHSYYVSCKNPENSLMRTSYEVEFDSAIFNKNIYGFQFHPEKSHKYGMQLLKNFANL